MDPMHVHHEHARCRAATHAAGEPFTLVIRCPAVKVDDPARLFAANSRLHVLHVQRGALRFQTTQFVDAVRKQAISLVSMLHVQQVHEGEDVDPMHVRHSGRACCGRFAGRQVLASACLFAVHPRLNLLHVQQI